MARESISLRQRYGILVRDHFTCMYCGRRPPLVSLEVDHVNPIAAGGSGEDRNLLTSCWDCNSGKSGISFPALPRQKTGRERFEQACSCERPTCGGPNRPRDNLELRCDCCGCHGCSYCGNVFCTSTIGPPGRQCAILVSLETDPHNHGLLRQLRKDIRDQYFERAYDLTEAADAAEEAARDFDGDGN